MRQPPRIAAWLLQRFATSERRESFMGDLFEEYQTGRTSGWYWRETLVALLLAAWREAASVFLAVIANSALVIWLFALSQQYRQLCPAPPILPNGPIVLVTCAGLAAAAIALMLWRSPLMRPIRVAGRAGLLRLSIVAFAAIGFGGGAVTWAGTSLCSTDRPVCPSSYETTSCDGPYSLDRNHPDSVLARSAGRVHLPGR